MAVDSGIPFARKHVISVLGSDTVGSNAAHTTTLLCIVKLSYRGINALYGFDHNCFELLHKR